MSDIHWVYLLCVGVMTINLLYEFVVFYKINKTRRDK